MARSARDKKKTTEEDLLDRLFDRMLGTGRLRTSMTYLTWTGLAVGVVLVLTVLVPRLEERRARNTEGKVPPVVIERAPAWLVTTPELVQNIEQMIGRAAGSRADDHEGLRTAHQVAVESGWFETVDRIERDADGTIHVRATMVTPFAVVRWRQNDHLVDQQGRLLDWTYPPGTAGAQLPLLVGTRTAPPTNQDGQLDYGAPWDHAEDVAAGLELARTIQGKPWMQGIGSIDIGAYSSRRCLWLQSERGPRICWGLAPNVRSAAEITPTEKLKLIDSIHGLYGPLERISVPEIDVRHDVATVRALADGSSLSSH